MLLKGVFGHLKLVLLLVAHIGIAGAANVLAQTQSVSTASSSSSSFGATSTGTHGSKSSSHKKKKLGKGPIGGIAVAVLVLVVLVALAIYFIYKRICGKRREVSSSAPVLPQSAPVSSIDEKDSIPSQSSAPPGVTYQPQHPQFQYIPGSNYQPGAPGYNPGYLPA